MELRATEDTDLSQDLIPPLPPIAASLHDRFLHSHCSSCFFPIIPKIPPFPSQNAPRIPPLPSQNAPAVPFSSCPGCNSVLYCSSACSSSDSHRHVSSSECRLLRQSDPSTCHESADIRAALRLLHSLETLGLLRTSSPPPGRIGGLFVGSLQEILNEGSETGTQIREGAELMRQARMGSGNEEAEELALWAVLANAVEVQTGDSAALGIAVYEPGFSWFNHSCAPNACYRFELHDGQCGSGGFLVSPVGTGETSEMWKIWFIGESKLIQGLHIYGPRIIVRSVKPIKKGEQLFIAYTDLLQPKAMRHLDLWLKYRFICCCERCLASPEMYIDYILNCDARDLVPNRDNFSDADSEELADFVDQTISEYMSGGNPETCCKMLENMLSKIFKYRQFQEEQLTFRLHPLHYLSLNAYLTLASVYRILASNIIATSSGEGDLSEASKMHRAAAAYSLLLAGATHHIFLSESSLIASTTVFWINAGESVMGLVTSSCEPKCSLVSCHSQFNLVEDTSVSMDDCKATSMRFCECISTNLTKSWPYLVQGLSYLEDIESPIDFSWLGTKIIPEILTAVAGAEFCEHSEYKYRVETCLEDDKKGLLQLAVYCLAYGRYLASICYGPQCDLSDKVGNLLHDIK